jgi:hypothetical protein
MTNANGTTHEIAYSEVEALPKRLRRSPPVWKRFSLSELSGRGGLL